MTWGLEMHQNTRRIIEDLGASTTDLETTIFELKPRTQSKKNTRKKGISNFNSQQFHRKKIRHRKYCSPIYSKRESIFYLMNIIIFKFLERIYKNAQILLSKIFTLSIFFLSYSLIYMFTSWILWCNLANLVSVPHEALNPFQVFFMFVLFRFISGQGLYDLQQLWDNTTEYCIEILLGKPVLYIGLSYALGILM